MAESVLASALIDTTVLERFRVILSMSACSADLLRKFVNVRSSIRRRMSNVIPNEI